MGDSEENFHEKDHAHQRRGPGTEPDGRPGERQARGVQHPDVGPGADHGQHLQGDRPQGRAGPPGGLRGLRRQEARVSAPARREPRVLPRKLRGGRRGRPPAPGQAVPAKRSGDHRAGRPGRKGPQGRHAHDLHLASRPLRRPDAEPPEHGDFPQDRRRRVAQEPDGAHGADLGRGAGGVHRPHRRDEPDQAGALPRLLCPAQDVARNREQGQDRPRAGPDPPGGRFRGALAQGLLHDGDLGDPGGRHGDVPEDARSTSTRSPPATSR